MWVVYEEKKSYCTPSVVGNFSESRKFHILQTAREGVTPKQMLQSLAKKNLKKLLKSLESLTCPEEEETKRINFEKYISVKMLRALVFGELKYFFKRDLRSSSIITQKMLERQYKKKKELSHFVFHMISSLRAQQLEELQDEVRNLESSNNDATAEVVVNLESSNNDETAETVACVNSLIDCL